jgi:hypothetical protein
MIHPMNAASIEILAQIVFWILIILFVNWFEDFGDGPHGFVLPCIITPKYENEGLVSNKSRMVALEKKLSVVALIH